MTVLSLNDTKYTPYVAIFDVDRLTITLYSRVENDRVYKFIGTRNIDFIGVRIPAQSYVCIEHPEWMEVVGN